MTNGITKFERKMNKVQKELQKKGFQNSCESWLYGENGGSCYFEISIVSDLDEFREVPYDSISGQCEEWRYIRVSDHDPKHNVRTSIPDGYVGIDPSSTVDEIVGWIINQL